MAINKSSSCNSAEHRAFKAHYNDLSDLCISSLGRLANKFYGAGIIAENEVEIAEKENTSDGSRKFFRSILGKISYDPGVYHQVIGLLKEHPELATALGKLESTYNEELQNCPSTESCGDEYLSTAQPTLNEFHQSDCSIQDDGFVEEPSLSPMIAGDRIFAQDSDQPPRFFSRSPSLPPPPREYKASRRFSLSGLQPYHSMQTTVDHDRNHLTYLRQEMAMSPHTTMPITNWRFLKIENDQEKDKSQFLENKLQEVREALREILEENENKVREIKVLEESVRTLEKRLRENKEKEKYMEKFLRERQKMLKEKEKFMEEKEKFMEEKKKFLREREEGMEEKEKSFREREKVMEEREKIFTEREKGMEEKEKSLREEGMEEKDKFLRETKVLELEKSTTIVQSEKSTMGISLNENQEKKLKEDWVATQFKLTKAEIGERQAVGENFSKLELMELILTSEIKQFFSPFAKKLIVEVRNAKQHTEQLLREAEQKNAEQMQNMRALDLSTRSSERLCNIL